MNDNISLGAALWDQGPMALGRVRMLGHGSAPQMANTKGGNK